MYSTAVLVSFLASTQRRTVVLYFAVLVVPTRTVDFNEPNRTEVLGFDQNAHRHAAIIEDHQTPAADRKTTD